MLKMRIAMLSAAVPLVLLACGAPAAPPATDAPPAPAEAPAVTEQVVVFETTLGTMTVELLDDVAPKTVAQVKRLVAEGFYDGVAIYRVVDGHVIQFGDGGENDQPTVPAELAGPKHTLGVVGLARDQDPDSGNTELYICLADRPHLDGAYATFGRVVEGLDTLVAIGKVPVDEKWDGQVAMHVPKEPVTIVKAYLLTRPSRST